MRRLTLSTAVALLALPASAFAASGNGLVLSIDSAHRMLEVVDASHVVHAFHYRGRLPRLHAGARISFHRSGQAISHVRAAARQGSSVAFFGRVVRSSKYGLVLRLADGRKVSFSSKQIRHRRPKPAQRHKRHARAAFARVALAGLTINFQGLQPGVIVLVTETVDQQGNVTITISFPPRSDPVVGGQRQATGTVSDVGDDAFVLTTGDGSDLRLHMAASALAQLGLQLCDTLEVTYHQDSGMLIADHVTPTGSSSSGDCASNQAEQDAVGTITKVSDSNVTVSTADQGTLSINVDSADLTAGFQVGDAVDVTYVDDGGGVLDAVDVQYVEQDAAGTVTAVSDGSMTITAEETGQAVTFTANPSDGMFDGVAVGDHVDVQYHQSAGQLTPDSVDDSGGD